MNRQDIITKHRQSKSIKEFERKAKKALRKGSNLWTLEEIDLAKAEATILAKYFEEHEEQMKE